ncbi:MAG: CPBP family intramembrane glutamic endopeptidase [Halarsenatibacteraceae bacterium]
MRENNKIKKTEIGVRQGIGFIRLAIVLSWLGWLPAAISQESMVDSNFVMGFYLLGRVMLIVASLIFIFVNYNSRSRQRIKKELFTKRNFSIKWALFIILIPVIFNLVTAGLSKLILNNEIQYLSQISFESLLSLGPVFIILLLIPAIYEELAWRGIALYELQNGWSSLKSGLIVGLAMIVWQLPLYFIIGTSHSTMTVTSIQFWLYQINILILAVILTWIYNRTGRSLLAVILFNFTYYFTEEIFQFPAGGNYFLIGLYLLFVIFLIKRDALDK